MRLTDLDPRWFGWTHEGQGVHVGLTFLCPQRCGERLGVEFRNPIGIGGYDPAKIHWPNVGFQWDRSGDTFDTLTLSPSIDASKLGHWHGHISNGNVT